MKDRSKIKYLKKMKWYYISFTLGITKTKKGIPSLNSLESLLTFTAYEWKVIKK